MLAAGDRAPDFQLPALEGDSRALLGSGGRSTLLAFFKVNCPTCQLAMPFLDRLAKGSLRVIAISQNDAVATRNFNQHFQIGMETLLDFEGTKFAASDAYGLESVPSLFLIDRDGKVQKSMAGFSKADFLGFGEQAGVEVFHAGEAVPDWKAG